MSVKIALLKSGESLISDIKELVSDDKVCGYLFKKPYLIFYSENQVYLSESETQDKNQVNVSFKPWISFTDDEEIPVGTDWLVTVVSPVQEIEKLYQEINGRDS